MIISALPFWSSRISDDAICSYYTYSDGAVQIKFSAVRYTWINVSQGGVSQGQGSDRSEHNLDILTGRIRRAAALLQGVKAIFRRVAPPREITAEFLVITSGVMIRSLLLVSTLSILLSAQSVGSVDLPLDAVVIERATIPHGIHPARELILWMLSPQRHDRGDLSESNPYTCPEWTMGSYFRGPTRLSLVDTNAKRLINTIKLHRKGDDEDSFDVPYRILAGYFYTVPDRERGQDGKPALLALRDLNGDGLPLETAFFEARACMGLWTTLIGYSLKQDGVIQYEVELKITGQKIVKGRGIVKTGNARTETASWVDYLFSRSPDRPGRWEYQIDYTGRAGDLDSYKVRYDRSREKFFGTLFRLKPPWADQ